VSKTLVTSLYGLTYFVDAKSEDSIYFCGNSLGLQPKATAKYLEAHLETWSSIAVNGHFTDLEDSPLCQWQHMAETAAAMSTDIVGASASEIAIMGSLTSNLHMLMASFYQPTPTKHKIILEWKSFPSDHVS
jgi:kynureninase